MAWTFYDYCNPYKLSDGTKILLTVQQWAEMTLTGDDLAEWETDFAAINAYEAPLIASGDMENEILDSSITVGDSAYNTLQGNKIAFPNASTQPDFHANWIKWADRMQLDPNVTWIAGEWKEGDFVE